MAMVDILVVGQTPPPFHGQSIMIARMLEGRFSGLRLYHVRMAFSKDGNEVGRPRPSKLLHLLSVIGRILIVRLRHKPTILYYPPAGPNRLPMYRDMAILLATRWLFRQTIFHFHASGLTELINDLTWPERLLFRLAYGRPDCAIRVSEHAAPDGARLGARQSVVVPYGLTDYFARLGPKVRSPGYTPRILFVGAVCEAKGIMLLLEAGRRLKQQGLPFHLVLVGQPASAAFENDVKRFITSHSLSGHVSLPGLVIGDAKWAAYQEADVFCLPSHYSSEAMPTVILEAMQFCLPVVATRWRGIPSMVREGETGYLVPIGDVTVLTERLGTLLTHPREREEMGKRAREAFLSEFTLERFYARIEAALLATAAVQLPPPKQLHGTHEDFLR
jgi:glycosyltransferase involved in cell wall biosynthesis